MDIRKIIKFGSSSYVVSLPKNWVDKNKLNKGDVLYFNENGDNELVIAPSNNEKKKQLSKITIEIKNKPLDTIRREIMSAYIQNNDIIKIIGDLSPVRQNIDNMLHELLALEIMEDTPDRIVIKDFLNLDDISLQDIIRRMDIMVRTMLNDVDTSFSKNMHEKLLQIEKSVNKLMFLVFRVTRKGMKEHSILKSLKVECCGDLMDYWLLADKLEGVADDCRRIARFLKKADIKKLDSSGFRDLFNRSRGDYLSIMKALYARDINVAHAIASSIDKRLAEWDTLFYNSEEKIAGPLVERFKAIDGQLRNVARIIVDRSVKVEQSK